MGLFTPGWWPALRTRLIPTVQPTGSSATLEVTAGVLTLAGQDLFFEIATPAGIGNLTLVGQAIALNGTQGMTVSAGALTLTGQSIALAHTVSLPSANLTLTGQGITLVGPTSISFGLDAAVLTLTGQPLPTERAVVWEPGVLSLTGQDIAFLFDELEPPQFIALCRFIPKPDQIRFSVH
jgi:hypothetical protein